MKYSLLSKDFLSQKSDCLVMLLTASNTVTANQSNPAPLSALNSKLNGVIADYLHSGDIKSKAGEISWLMTPDQSFKRILFIGLGKAEALSTSKLRKALATGMTALNNSPVSKAVFLSCELEGASRENVAAANVTAEAILALECARYSFSQCKSKKQQRNSNKLKQIQFVAEKKNREAIEGNITKACALAKGICLAKDLGNLPGNICTPEYLADEASKLAKAYSSIKTHIMGEKELKGLGMGSLLSVAAGSAQPARLITMEYRGGKKGQPPHALVGKGITFDSGGISLKPGAGMDEMKFDMCGAASVFGTLKALAECQAPLNVIGVIAAAENMPGSRATKPGDIVTSMSGQTIEILNTDAEGRLVLCDALTYCEKFNPETIVDIATLTGACVIALGHETAGLLANDDKLAKALIEAGNLAGDRAWQLPLFEEYQQQLDSNFADMQNIGGRSAGTITAACFLSRFTQQYRWAHLDIAGVAWHSGKNKGATGRPVGLLLEYLLAAAINEQRK